MYAVIRAGRWVQGSKSFFVYFEEGSMLRTRMLDDNEKDEIFNFWKWEPITYSDIKKRVYT
jgi:hypothetical protein